MTASFPFTVYNSPFTVPYPFIVIHEHQQLTANGKCMVNGKRPMVNASLGEMK